MNCSCTADPVAPPPAPWPPTSRRPHDGGPTVDLVGRSSAVVHLAGDLDAVTAVDLEAFLAAVVGGGAPGLVLDLAEVTFCDCTGLGVLLRTRRLAVAHGGWLRLERVPAQVLRLLRLTRTSALLGTAARPAGERTPGE